MSRSNCQVCLGRDRSNWSVTSAYQDFIIGPPVCALEFTPRGDKNDSPRVAYFHFCTRNKVFLHVFYVFLEGKLSPHTECISVCKSVYSKLCWVNARANIKPFDGLLRSSKRTNIIPTIVRSSRYIYRLQMID